MARALPKNQQVYLKALSDAGDMVAKSIIQMCMDINWVLPAAVGGVVAASGQIVDGVGNPVGGVQNVLLTTKSVTPSTIAVVTGTEIAGGGTDEVWLQTTATGAFAVNVADSTPTEKLLLVAHTDDGLIDANLLQF